MNQYLSSITPMLFFNLKRTIKSKFWIITTIIFTLINIGLFIGFSFIYKMGFGIMAPLLLIVPSVIGLFYISLISFSLTNQLFIRDKNIGLYGLEIRMGRSASQIFWTKLLVQKIFVYGWIIINWCLFLITVLPILNFDVYFFFTISFGLFGLFIYEWFFSGIIYLISLSKNSKLTSWISAIIMTLFIFFPIFAGTIFTMTEGAMQNDRFTDYQLFYYKQKSLEMKNKNQLFFLFEKDLKTIYDLNFDSIIYQRDKDWILKDPTLYDFIDQGVVSKKDMEKLINETMTSNEGKRYKITFKKVDNTSNYWFNESFTNKFFTIIEEKVKLDNLNYSSSWFNNNDLKNYYDKGQLKEFFDLINNQNLLNEINQLTNQKISIEELNELVEYVSEQFKNYYLIKPSRDEMNRMSTRNGWLATFKNDVTSNFLKIHEGQRLFTKILFRSIGYYDINRLESGRNSVYYWNLKQTNEMYETKTSTRNSLLYLSNPFSTLLGGVLHSNLDSYIYDLKIYDTFTNGWTFMKPILIREVKVDYEIIPKKDDEEQSVFDPYANVKISSVTLSEKRLPIWSFYVIYLGFQIITILITYGINVFKKTQKVKTNPEKISKN